MTENRFATRRAGYWYRYSTTFLDSRTVALLEYDNGRHTPPTPPTADGRREPTRTLAVVPVSKLDELEDVAAKWNAENSKREDYERHVAPKERAARIEETSQAGRRRRHEDEDNG